jgi:hypothetical protein
MMPGAFGKIGMRYPFAKSDGEVIKEQGEELKTRRSADLRGWDRAFGSRGLVGLSQALD